MTERTLTTTILCALLGLAACGGDQQREARSETVSRSTTSGRATVPDRAPGTATRRDTARGAQAAPATQASRDSEERRQAAQTTQTAQDTQSSPETTVSDRSNDLRRQYSDVEGTLYNVGEVTYYSDAFAGQRTASGDRYDPQQFTAATDTQLPLGTVVRVERVGTDRSVIVRINDRMAVGNQDDRILDLSRAAAEELGILERGVTEARIVVLERPGRGTPATAAR